MSATKTRRQQVEPWRQLTPQRMRAAREALGLTQAQFALLLGRRLGHGYAPDWTHVQRWEAGGRRPGRVWGPVYHEIVAAVEEAQRRREQDGDSR